MATAKINGEVSEWLIELVSKTSVLVRVPGVRIPPSPFFKLNKSLISSHKKSISTYLMGIKYFALNAR